MLANPAGVTATCSHRRSSRFPLPPPFPLCSTLAKRASNKCWQNVGKSCGGHSDVPTPSLLTLATATSLSLVLYATQKSSNKNVGRMLANPVMVTATSSHRRTSHWPLPHPFNLCSTLTKRAQKKVGKMLANLKG